MSSSAGGERGFDLELDAQDLGQISTSTAEKSFSAAYASSIESLAEDEGQGPPSPQIVDCNDFANATSHSTRLLYLVTFEALRADLYYVDEGSDLHLKKGDLVIVEGDRGEDLGTKASGIVPFFGLTDFREKAMQEHH